MCTNCYNLLVFIIKNWTLFACYLPILTLCLCYTKAEPSLLFVLKAGLFRLIVCTILTIFNINIPFFISWKPNVVFVHQTCHRWSTNLLDVDLIKENYLGGCQRWKFLFVVPRWFMPYFRLLHFVINKQYG